MLGRLWSVPTARQRAQSVVDYGLIIAAAAIVSIAGLNAMTRAQEAYWTGTTPTFASPTPSTGTFTHATKITINGPNCDPAVTYIAGSSTAALKTVNCTAKVQDISPDVAERTPPQGTLQLQMDSGAVLTCATGGVPALTPSGPDSSSCPVWVHDWSRPEAEQGIATNPHKVQAFYTATTNHQPGSSTPVLSFTVVPRLDVKVSCNNPIYTVAAWNNSTEVGHPLICSPTLLDFMNGSTPYNSAVPTPVDIASKPGGGVPSFGCYTNNSWAAFAGCLAPTPTVSCAVPTNGNGIPSTGALNCPNPSFIYRRGYDDSLGVLGPPSPAVCQPGASPPDGCWSDSFTFSVLSQTLNSPITITAPAESVGIDRGHSSGTFVQCNHVAGIDFGDDPGSAVSAKDLVMKGTSAQLPRAGQAWVSVAFQTAHKIEYSLMQPITCTAIVFDGDPSAMFDRSGCVHIPASYCNPDASDAHPPLGMVIFQDTTSPVTQYVQCSLKHATTRPTYLGALPAGQPEYASWCQVTFNVGGPSNLPGNTTIQAKYQQEPSLLPPGFLPAHAASYSPDIAVDFQ